MNNNVWNLFVAIKNGQLVKHSFIYHNNDKNSKALLKVLWNNGFILGYKINLKHSNKIIVYLKYWNKQPAIKLIKLISSPTKWLYCSINQIYKINTSGWFIIFFTNKGLQPINNCKWLKIGGEPIVLIK